MPAPRLLRGTIAPFVLLVLLLVGMQPAAGGVIDISGGNLSACCWGGAGGIAYGQIFTVPAGERVLVNYSFSLDSLNAQFPFVSQVYAWNGSGVTGPSLFTSGVLFSPLPLDVFATTVLFPSIAVTAGQQYIALVTNQPSGVSLGAPADSGGGMFLNQDNPYAGGQFAFKGGNPETGPWALTLSNADAVFHATFVPEPATLFLFGVGLAGLMGVGSWGRRGPQSAEPVSPSA
jgi:hypothetical protein